MTFNLRTPIGLIFTIYGALLLLYGKVGNSAPSPESNGLRLDVEWGVAMLIVGVLLLLRRKRR